jgi:LacI family transcriptional regulator
MTGITRTRIPTIAQVAHAAGVSTMTVSRVLNGRPDVAAATRTRVERALEDCGYARNRAATALRRGASGLIDLVVVGLESEYWLEIIRGVEERLEGTDLRMALSATHDEARHERHWLAKTMDGSTDGVILVLAHGEAEALESLRQRGTPFVVVDHRGELRAEVPSVGATNWLGARNAAEHLRDLGHRRIGYIGGPPAFGCSQQRFSGFRSALEMTGLPVDRDLLRDGDFQYDTGYRQTLALLDLPAPPTAIFAGNDMQALGALRALRDRGLVAPRQISIVGFDDLPVAALSLPALTTVRQPLAEMGSFAVEMLLKLIAGEPLSSARVELATNLIVRESTAPPDDLG